MTAALDDQVRLMESAWFMSYPHDVYARLRREAPVYWSERDQTWAISKYEDIRWISKQPELFVWNLHPEPVQMKALFVATSPLGVFCGVFPPLEPHPMLYMTL